MANGNWTVDSWRSCPIEQQPEYPDRAQLDAVLTKIGSLPPIVQPGEVTRLKHYLAEVAAGKRFILQGGDCAERFDECRSDSIEAKLKILLQMSLVLVWGARVPLVRIGRIAGQYMKPRTKPMEKVNGREVYAYKGDSINSFDDLEKRTPDPQRLLDSYFHSTATMNYLRGLLNSGFADLQSHNWDLSFVQDDAARKEYLAVVEGINHALEFMNACGSSRDPELSRVELFSSHEGLVLDFEAAMTRQVDEQYFNLGAHMIWIGDRTRQLDGAHIEYFRGIANPVGVKVGPSTVPANLVKLLKTLNPDNEPGKVVIITRFGVGNVDKMLPAIIQAIVDAGLVVVWECDPMHGNTRSTDSGIKTRSFHDILGELLSTFTVHDQMGTWLGGIHFEMTGSDVTECTGGSVNLMDSDLSKNYQSFCDPRLNAQQSLEMALLVTDRLRKIKSK